MPRKNLPRIRERKPQYRAYLFLLPNLLGFLVFVSLPVVASFLLGFSKFDLVHPAKLVGLENYKLLFSDLGQLFPDVFNGLLQAFKSIFSGGVGNIAAVLKALFYPKTDAEFGMALWNTILLMGGIPFTVLGSLFLAVVLSQKFRGLTVFRTVYFLPTVCAGIAVLILWKWILQDPGLLNDQLAVLGITAPNWLQDIYWVKPAFILMGIWMSVGGVDMVLYLAALAGIDPELYEAAEIDGAGAWRKFWTITWPMVSPTTFFIVVMSVIAGFQGWFEAGTILTDGGGPVNATTTVSLFIFTYGFGFKRMGYAAAAAWILFAIVFVATMLNWRFGGRRVVY